jgi:hypothetical protein
MAPGHAASRMGRHPVPAQRGFTGIWIRSFFVVFVLCAAWSLATPLGAAPDEPAQIVKAAATVRGELIGQPAPDEPDATRDFRVPALFQSVYALPTCYQFHATIPAGCAPHLRASGQIVTVSTYVGRYPPLYYSVVGLPTLFSHSESVIYFMRLISALLAALLLSLALTIASIWCRSTMMVVAIALTVTPLAIFYAAVVNPSGFEMAAAVCVWTSGLALVRSGLARPPRAVLITFVVTGCLLELTRGLSVLWMALILVTLGCLEPAACRQLLRLRSVRIGAWFLGVVGALALFFVLIAHTLEVLPSAKLPPHHQSFVVLTDHILGQIGGYVEQLIGLFGWLDTPSPLLSTIVLTSLLGFLIVLGLAVSRTREGVVLFGLIVASLVITVALIESNAGTSGITWQARDGFPLYAGIPLVAGMVVPQRAIFGFEDFTRRRIALLLAAGIGVTQLADFLWTLRRYTVGLGKTVNLFQSVKGGWSPPSGTLLVVVLGTVAVVLYAALLFRRISSQQLAGPTGLAARDLIASIPPIDDRALVPEHDAGVISQL